MEKKKERPEQRQRIVKSGNGSEKDRTEPWKMSGKDWPGQSAIQQAMNLRNGWRSTISGISVGKLRKK